MMFTILRLIRPDFISFYALMYDFLPLFHMFCVCFVFDFFVFLNFDVFDHFLLFFIFSCLRFFPVFNLNEMFWTLTATSQSCLAEDQR